LHPLCVVRVVELLRGDRRPETVDLTEVPHQVCDLPVRAGRHAGGRIGCVGNGVERVALTPDLREVVDHDRTLPPGHPPTTACACVVRAPTRSSIDSRSRISHNGPPYRSCRYGIGTTRTRA